MSECKEIRRLEATVSDHKAAIARRDAKIAVLEDGCTYEQGRVSRRDTENKRLTDENKRLAELDARDMDSANDVAWEQLKTQIKEQDRELDARTSNWEIIRKSYEKQIEHFHEEAETASLRIGRGTQQNDRQTRRHELHIKTLKHKAERLEAEVADLTAKRDVRQMRVIHQGERIDELEAERDVWQAEAAKQKDELHQSLCPVGGDRHSFEEDCAEVFEMYQELGKLKGMSGDMYVKELEAKVKRLKARLSGHKQTIKDLKLRWRQYAGPCASCGRTLPVMSEVLVCEACRIGLGESHTLPVQCFTLPASLGLHLHCNKGLKEQCPYQEPKEVAPVTTFVCDDECVHYRNDCLIENKSRCRAFERAPSTYYDETSLANEGAPHPTICGDDEEGDPDPLTFPLCEGGCVGYRTVKAEVKGLKRKFEEVHEQLYHLYDATHDADAGQPGDSAEPEDGTPYDDCGQGDAR